MIAKIELEEIKIYAYHGCYKEEQEVGNNFTVNVTLEVDATKPAASDDIKDALNYVAVYEAIKEEMAVKSHLLENVVARICTRLRKDFCHLGLIGGEIKVAKITPPVGGEMKSVAVKMSI